MSMVGHKTESIYRRYAIVDEQMQREAAARLDACTAMTAPQADRHRQKVHAEGRQGHECYQVIDA